jgi:hypothetical protein
MAFFFKPFASLDCHHRISVGWLGAQTPSDLDMYCNAALVSDFVLLTAGFGRYPCVLVGLSPSKIQRDQGLVAQVARYCQAGHLGQGAQAPKS